MIKKQKYRKQALKGACSRLRTMGVHYLGAGCKLKENKITITKKKKKRKRKEQGIFLVYKDPLHPDAQSIHTSSCTSRGWVEEALLPTELIRTEWSTTVVSGLGLAFDKLE